MIRQLAEEIIGEQWTIVTLLEYMLILSEIKYWCVDEKRKKTKLLIDPQHLAWHRATRRHNDGFMYKTTTGAEKCHLHDDVK